MNMIDHILHGTSPDVRAKVEYEICLHLLEKRFRQFVISQGGMPISYDDEEYIREFLVQTLKEIKEYIFYDGEE